MKGARMTASLFGAALCLLLAQQAAAANVLKDVKASAQADGRTAITLQFEQPVGEIKAFSTGNPPRIAIDLPDTANAFAQRRLAVDSALAKSVNTVEADGRTRVVVELAKDAGYRTQAMGNALVLTIEAKASAAQAVSVAGIDFKRADNGSGRLVVRFDGAGAAADVKESGSEVVVDIGNASLPADLQRKMDVAGYATPVLNVDARNVGGKTRLVLNTKGKADLMAYQTGNEYVIEISPKAMAAAPGGDAARIGATGNGRKTTAYTGRPVTFNFQDVPVRTVLQLIAEESNLNVVAADSVGGNVTLRLVNVPWDQALEIVLRAKGLDKRRDGNVIWVGPQAELAQYEQAKEDARIAIENREETVTEYIPINYGNAEAIAKLLTEDSKSGTGGGGTTGQQQRGFLSPRGSVSFDARTNTLLVIDIPKKVAEVKQLLATLDRAVDQVMIEARIVVAQDSFGRELGARFGINDRYPVDGTNPGVSRDSGFNSSLGLTNPAGILNFSILGRNTSLDIELQAMETKGRGEVISNPRVITSNQKAAVIRQGDEVGYVTTQATGTTTVPQATVQFKEVLLELKVTPTITQDGRVFLDMGVKKDEIKDFLSTPTGDIPQIQKREVSTAVLVDDGQTVVIGGVYEFKNRDDVSKVPFLGDIPFLGALFKKSDRSQEKAELLIFVTPRIIKPAPRTVAPAYVPSAPAVPMIERADRN
ncbi:secretin [Arenimonas maotaiensis]|uniref:Secretin n=2 Tax=Arenimonas maotaiensis TaxID=1446479 RepID=A0A917CFL4_9GAMM|nr:secretin [Arenimonas maotaiensis]